ncbi:MAG TPA: C2 family cysteine protease [Tepidisphaeraceae bacterium]|nr:C2 family cysteine protease [Tepidisphaeraceae bacterium]
MLRPAIESLEARRMLANDALATASVEVASSQWLRITGTSNADMIVVRKTTSTKFEITNGSWEKSVIGSFAGVIIDAKDGNDRVSLATDGLSFKVSILGGAGNDILSGGALSDTIVGGEGNDFFLGGESNDLLLGEVGNDSLNGSFGDDSLNGGAGDDSVYGNAGNDLVDGGTDIDRVHGGTGRDTLIGIGGSGKDTLTGAEDLHSFWLDNDVSEKITDVSETENEVGAIHRVSSFVNGANKTLDGQNLPDPAGNGTLKNFKNHKLFGPGGPSAYDIVEGAADDSWFLSTLSSIVSKDPEFVRQMITNLGDGTFAVRFKTSTGADQYVRVDADLRTANAKGTTLKYAGFCDDNTMWVAVVEKALTFVRPSQSGYAKLFGGWTSQACQLLGVDFTTFTRSSVSSASQLVSKVNLELQADRAVTITVNDNAIDIGLTEGNVYVITSLVTNSDNTKSFKLRTATGGYRTVSAANMYAYMKEFTAATVEID